MRLRECQELVRSEDGPPLTVGSSKKETAIAKLLQVSVTISALWEVQPDNFVCAVFKSPTTVRAIEKNNAESLMEGTTREVVIPDWARSAFNSHTRMVVADAHSANEKADLAIAFERRDWQQLIKLLCMLHKKHRSAFLQWQVFPMEVQGLLHTTLSLSFTGSMRKFRKSARKFLDNFLVLRPYGSAGAGEDAADFRRHVNDKFGKQAHDLSGPRSAKRLKARQARDRLLNGDWRKAFMVEHYCKGCCSNRKDCLKQCQIFIIDEWERPPGWCRSRWLGSEDALDWNGLLMNLHGMLVPIYLHAFFGKPWDKPCPDDADGDDDNAGSDHAEADAHGPGEEVHDGPDLPEPQPEMDAMQRQKTYRNNAIIWFDSDPRGRLWILKELHHEQQTSQKRLLAQVGSGWEDRELLKECLGGSARFRCKLAHDGEFTHPYLRAYAEMARTPARWNHLSQPHRTHFNAVLIFRGAAASSAAMAQLEMWPQRAWPFIPVELLSKQRSKQMECAKRIMRDFTERPCVMDPFWFHHVKVHFYSIDRLIGPRCIAFVKQVFMLAEIDNGSVEASNAQLLRFTRAHLQTHKIDLLDLSALWVLGGSKSEALSPYGPGEVVHYADDADVEVEEKKMAAGGGGLQRAFVSKFASQHRKGGKDNNATIDFATIGQMYRDELAKPHSEILETLREPAAAATEVARANFKLFQSHGNSKKCISGLGCVPKRLVQKQQQAVEDEALMSILRSAASASVSDASVAGAFDEHAVVPYQHNVDGAEAAVDAEHLISAIVTFTGSSDIRVQRQHIARISRVHARQRAKVIREEVERFRECVRRAPLFNAVDFCSVPMLPPGAYLRPYTYSGLPVVRWSDNGLPEAVRSVSTMLAAHASLGTMLERCWHTEHMFIANDALDPIGTLPTAARPTECFRRGMGQCICRGRGYLVALARTRLAQVLATQAPKKTTMRKHMVRGQIIATIGEFVFHISLMYFRPVRPTYVQLERDEPEFFHGFDAYRCKYNGEGFFQIVSDISALEMMNLDQPLTVRLLKLVSLSVPLDPFVPGTRLLAQNLEAPLDSPIQFWDGSEEELRKDERQREQQRHRAEKRAAKAQAAPPRAKCGPHPQAAPGRRPQANNEEQALQSCSEDEDSENCFMGIASTAQDDVPISDIVQQVDRDEDEVAELFGDFESDEAEEGYKLFIFDVLPMWSLLPLAFFLRFAPYCSCCPHHCMSCIYCLLCLCLPFRFVRGLLEDLDGKAEDDDEDAYWEERFSDDCGIVGRNEHLLHCNMAEEKEKDDEDEGHKDKVEKSTRGKHVDEVEGVPPGCFLRKFVPDNKLSFWWGRLTSGFVDADGKANQQRNWARGTKTEDEVRDGILEWLWEHCG